MPDYRTGMAARGTRPFSAVSSMLNLKRQFEDAKRQHQWKLENETLQQRGRIAEAGVNSNQLRFSQEASGMASGAFKDMGLEVNPQSNQFSEEAPEGMEVIGYRKDNTPIYRKLTISGDKAGLYTLANESIGNVQDVKKLLFPDGTPNSFRRDLALRAQLGKNKLAPNDKEGQRIFRKLSTALSARQLIQTGVAAREDETKMLYNQFYGGVLSNPEALFEGLDQLGNFYDNYNQVLGGKRTLSNPNRYEQSSTGGLNSTDDPEYKRFLQSIGE